MAGFEPGQELDLADADQVAVMATGISMSLPLTSGPARRVMASRAISRPETV